MEGDKLEIAINDTIEFYLKKLKEDGHDDEYDRLQKVRSDVINGRELSPRPPLDEDPTFMF